MMVKKKTYIERENIKKCLRALEGEQISAHVVASFWFHKKHIQGVLEFSTESKEISCKPVEIRNMRFNWT